MMTCRAERAKHHAVMHRLRRGDGGIDVTHRRTGDHAALHYCGWLHAEKGGGPEHQIRQLPGLNRTDFVGDAVSQRRVNGVLGNVALHAQIIVITRFFR